MNKSINKKVCWQDLSISILLVFFLVAIWSAPVAAASSLVLTSVQVTGDASRCNNRWIATVRNQGSNASGGNVVAQGYQGKGKGAWIAASGFSVAPVAPGATSKTEIGFNRVPGKTHLKVTLVEAGRVISQKIVDLPGDSSLKLAFANTRFTPGDYSIDIKNLGKLGLGNITVQAFTAPGRSGPWKPAGGGKPGCINSNASFTQKGGKPADHPYVRVDIKSNDSILKSVVLDSRRPKPVGAGGNLLGR